MMMLFDESRPGSPRAPSIRVPIPETPGHNRVPDLGAGTRRSICIISETAAAASYTLIHISSKRIIRNRCAGSSSHHQSPWVPDVLRALIPLGLDLADHLVHPTCRGGAPLHQQL